MYVHCQNLHLLSHYYLEIFINNSELSDLDPFVRLAIIHHQFESIHFFYDGNGRTGRIINILYMVKKELLYLPILCSSRYINQNKSHYYRLLQYTRDPNEWDEWVLFMLEAIEKKPVQTIFIIKCIKRLKQSYKERIRKELLKIYSQDLINNLFKHPYTKIYFVVEDLNVSRQTASRYLEQLVELKMVHLQKIG